MTQHIVPSGIDSDLERTGRAQSQAADPVSSAWVSANAGTGKTHVLTLRVLRLLLSGTPPERILCLTYTKAAAAEMSSRVFEKLAKWVTARETDLSDNLKKLIGRPANEAEIALARTLFTRAIETPGGLKVQTIHAFAERLLQRFPLEAGVPPGFKILDDSKTRELIAAAIEGTLREATNGNDQTPLAQALRTAIRYASDAHFDELLSKAISQRAWLTEASRYDLGKTADEFAGVSASLCATFGVPKGATIEGTRTRLAGVLGDDDLKALASFLGTGSAADIKHSATLKEALNQSSPAGRVPILAQYFLTTSGEMRKGLMTKSLAQERPDLCQKASRAQVEFGELQCILKGLSLVEASVALYRLAASVLQRYSNAKATSGTLDFDDLIASTTNLLGSAQSAEWVLYKLDGGLDHILVDEAQDTSPVQWQIIGALAREFYSGRGARDVVRTVFAVGDEKQSIYSFQGAEPEKFAAMGEQFAQVAANAGANWQRVPLNLSFRSVQPVLDAVDIVFANAAQTPGLSASGTAIRHVARRAGHGGRVEIWPLESHADSAAADPWQPLLDATERAPAHRLAERIAAQIGHWIDSGEMLESEGRPIRAGDILILVRKRHPFAVPMIAALKAHGIEVAGSDRIALADQIAIQDLIALGNFLTLPEDDLALATVLKGPLFNLQDDDLLGFAHARKGALWKSFLHHAGGAPALKAAAETLKRWRAKADFLPPFEFFSSLLDRDGGRTKILERLGAEASDAIDEFLDIALNHDDGAPPSLTGFLAELRDGRREVKRDMGHGRDEVRVMTVHGAKGLEAPIVFLPDTCTIASGDSPGTRLLKLVGTHRPAGTTDPVIWPVKGTSKLQPCGDAQRHKEGRETQERNRLLYVAMTRARDRLYIAGFEGKNGRSKGCWYDLMAGALKDHTVSAEGFAGSEVRRLISHQILPPEANGKTAVAARNAQALPPFALQRAPAEQHLSIPLAPSRLEAYAPDAEGEPLEPAARAKPDAVHAGDRPSPLTLVAGNRFLRGTLTHALLEHLPQIPQASRLVAATEFVAKRGGGLSSAVCSSIVKETLAILSDPSFEPLFAAASRAEVPISALLPRPTGLGPALRLSGKIDRIAVSGTEVLIVDYKTNRPPPLTPEAVAPAYLYQLAAYVLALKEIYPEHSVRAALLWSDGPRLMEIPRSMIEQYMERLWDLDQASLDAG